MANINVNVGDLYDRQTKMQSIGEDLVNKSKEVLAHAQSIVDGGWTGGNAQEYLDSFLLFHPKIVNKSNAILLVANALFKTAVIVGDLQENTKSKINNLGGGGSVSGTTTSPSTSEGIKSNGVNDTNTKSDTYVQGMKFNANSYANKYTDEEIFKLACIVAGEDSGSYEGALAVASTMCNRADAGNWGGSDPLTVAMAPNQFVAYTGDDVAGSNSLYAKYMSGRAQIPDYAVQATRDALNGTRNTTATSFRANPGEGRTQIGDRGNYYFV